MRTKERPPTKEALNCSRQILHVVPYEMHREQYGEYAY